MADCFTVSRHARLLAACLFLVGRGVFVCVFGLLAFYAGSMVDAFLNRASMDMTATVSSNAALGKKKLVHAGSCLVADCRAILWLLFWNKRRVI